MSTQPQLRVPHPLHRCKGWGIALCATALLITSTSAKAQASSGSCGLSCITDTVELTYPPIAKAAHVSGIVILIATFAEDGSVSETKLLSGPQMLLTRATEYVTGWKANSAVGLRHCPVVVTFRTIGQELECGSRSPHGVGPEQTIERQDPQHVTITIDRGKSCYTNCS